MEHRAARNSCERRDPVRDDVDTGRGNLVWIGLSKLGRAEVMPRNKPRGPTTAASWVDEVSQYTTVLLLKDWDVAPMLAQPATPSLHHDSLVSTHAFFEQVSFTSNSHPLF